MGAWRDRRPERRRVIVVYNNAYGLVSTGHLWQRNR